LAIAEHSWPAMLLPRSFFSGRNTCAPGMAAVNASTASSKFGVLV
jgi:hypothetical protein